VEPGGGEIVAAPEPGFGGWRRQGPGRRTLPAGGVVRFVPECISNYVPAATRRLHAQFGSPGQRRPPRQRVCKLLRTSTNV